MSTARRSPARWSRSQDAGWVDFKWQNPLTKAVEPKSMYEVRVGEYVVGVGAYAK